MSRKRMIDPSIWTDEGFLEVSTEAKLLFIGLISQADDEGRGPASPKVLQALIFSSSGVTAEVVQKALRECEEHLRVKVYGVDGRFYYQLKNWSLHQTINKPTASKIPAPIPEHPLNTPKLLREDYRSPTGAVTDSERSTTSEEKERKEEKEIEGTRESESSVSRTPLDEANEAQPEPSPSTPLSKKASGTKKEPKHKYGEYMHVLLTDRELERLKADFPDWAEKIRDLDEGIQLKGYKYDDHNLAIRKWAKRNTTESKAPSTEADKKRMVDPLAEAFKSAATKGGDFGIF